jgi:hypothetical protein
MKLVNLVTRRADLTRAAFRDYYEKHHAPLGTQYFPFEKYVRNHLVDSSPQEVGFDCVMECWLDHQKALGLLEGPAGDIFAEDEGKFMAQRAHGVEVEEILLTGSPRDLDTPELRKETLMLRRSPELDRSAFNEKVAAWGRELARQSGAGLIRMVFDKVTTTDTSALGADALLTAWFKDGAGKLPQIAMPQGISLVARVTTQPHETTASQLAAAFGSRTSKGNRS